MICTPKLLRLKPAMLACLCLLLAACGGGGSAGVADATAAVVSPVGTGTAPVTVAPVISTPVADVAPAPTAPVVATPTPATTLAPPVSPALPRAGLAPADLAVLVAQGDALSEAVARAYQLARGIPEANIIRVAVPGGNDVISDSAFATLKADIDARLPATVQATLVTWAQPSRVQGATCMVGITSALAFGYNPVLCGGCNRTQASAYYDTDTTRPWTDLRIRPSMMLGTATLDAAQALINRGLAAEASAPTGTGWLVRTADAARNVRWPDQATLPGAFATSPGPTLRYVDASAPGAAQEVTGQMDVLFYFTGLARLSQLGSNRFLPGAVADHLTSFGGQLPLAGGQTAATAWLAAGATASHGTVEEPCNHVQKFSRASVLVDHYTRGATVIEAYWKSVAWPGQSLFVGDPLARPWAHTPSATLEGGDLVVRTGALRRGGLYKVEWLASGSSTWRTLASQAAGQPRALTWRVPLPADTAGGRLRWVGPCALQPTQSCVLAGG